MRAAAGLAFGCCAIATVACGPSAPPVSSRKVFLEPAASLEAAPSVVRVHVTGLDVPPSALTLFRGGLDAYYASKVKSATVPDALKARQVSGVAWRAHSPGELVLAPSELLDANTTYGVAALGVGEIAAFETSDDAGVFAERVWPPPGFGRGGIRSVYCGPLGAPIGTSEIEYDPADAGATLFAGVGTQGEIADRCLHADLADASATGTAVPPPLVEETALDPSPISLDAAFPPVGSVACAADERRFGPGCAIVQDDRIVVRSTSEPLLWTVLFGPGQVTPASDGDEFVLGGLPPSSSLVLSGFTTDLVGREAAFTASVRTEPRRPHVVINEVLSNPAGPEPAQEWVELTNDGTASVNLGGFTLSDSSAAAALPPADVAPGQFVLVVTDDFDPTESRDVPPAAGTVLIRVARLGASGLSNSGEALTLRGADGAVLSIFPPLADPTPGVSVARSVPAALDADPRSFGFHSSPGASPGGENHIGPLK